nr:MAG TPA: Exodeoxyribonuclease 8 [Crassvirales sp.]
MNICHSLKYLTVPTMMTGCMIKSLREISWNVPEEVYRADPALSYSTLSKFKRSGFNELEHLFDRIDTPSLTFGSAVDSIITGGEEEFESRFMVAEFPAVPESIINVVKNLFDNYHSNYRILENIPDKEVIEVAAQSNYQNNWKPETRAKVIKEKGSTYYRLLYLSKDKTILDTATNLDVRKTVEALRNSPTTREYFAPSNPFENVERLYQLKFKATLNGIEYRCMADLLIVDYDRKIIIPVDLKTSGKPEWDFYKSFVDWRYDIQARLYWRIIRYNLDRDPYFKDFQLLDYQFIVANRRTLTPLIWQCEFTQKRGLIKFNDVVFEDPEEIGMELHTYLTFNLSVPIGIHLKEPNSLTEWLNK